MVQLHEEKAKVTVIVVGRSLEQKRKKKAKTHGIWVMSQVEKEETTSGKTIG